jgi:hypothetical protein
MNFFKLLFLNRDARDLLNDGHLLERWLKKGEGQRALAALNNLLRVYPRAVHYYGERARVKIHLADFDGCIADCDHGLNITINFMERGAYLNKTDYTEAIFHQSSHKNL